MTKTKSLIYIKWLLVFVNVDLNSDNISIDIIEKEVLQASDNYLSNPVCTSVNEYTISLAQPLIFPQVTYSATCLNQILGYHFRLLAKFI